MHCTILFPLLLKYAGQDSVKWLFPTTPIYKISPGRDPVKVSHTNNYCYLVYCRPQNG